MGVDWPPQKPAPLPIGPGGRFRVVTRQRSLPSHICSGASPADRCDEAAGRQRGELDSDSDFLFLSLSLHAFFSYENETACVRPVERLLGTCTGRTERAVGHFAEF